METQQTLQMTAEVSKLAREVAVAFVRNMDHNHIITLCSRNYSKSKAIGYQGSFENWMTYVLDLSKGKY